MVKSELVKKRKRKIIAAIVGGASTVGLVVFIIIAFLGQYVGSFTVAVNSRGKAQISIYDNKELNNPTTFLKIGDIPQFSMYTANKISDHDKIDSDSTDFTYGGFRDKDGNLKWLYFLKYTFFLKNTGNVPVNYTFTINVVENVKPSNVTDYDLIDLSRVRLYSNMDDAHTYETYAKTSKKQRIDEEGNPTYNRPIAGELGTPEYCGFAKPYISEKVLISNTTELFMPNTVVRYTFVMWLEGEDECSTGVQPENCSIKLGVEISGYETVEDK